MRQFEFTPGYYEWHLTDAATDEILLNVCDPSEELYWGDTCEPLTREELFSLVSEWLNEAERCYSDNEEFNGILPECDGLDALEMKAAADLMTETLYNYYLAA